MKLTIKRIQKEKNKIYPVTFKLYYWYGSRFEGWSILQKKIAHLHSSFIAVSSDSLYAPVESKVYQTKFAHVYDRNGEQKFHNGKKIVIELKAAKKFLKLKV